MVSLHMTMMNRRLLCLTIAFAYALSTAHAGILRQGRTLLLCHRTANRDLPENTLESLALAARMGCDVIEVDVTRTLDGQLVLNHDNFLDRFTSSTGEVEHTDLRELDRMDFGAWRGQRFRGMQIAHFDDALRLARELNVDLYLDIKSKGIGSKVLDALAREGMTDRVMFGGEWDDVKALSPRANPDPVADLQPGFRIEDVKKLHAQGKVVLANFIYNGHETDLDSMRAAVAARVDGIMVDYPRLGAEAVGRPVEQRLGQLAKRAETGAPSQRFAAIRELSEFTGFPLQRHFLRWIDDADDAVSHEAALALVTSQPPVGAATLEPATHFPNASARRNAAWAIGSLSAEQSDSALCVPLLLPMLDDPDQSVMKEALLAITWCPSPSTHAVPEKKLLALLTNKVPIVRGLAAVALAKYHPDIAGSPILAQLHKEESEAAAYDAAWAARGRARLTQPKIDRLVELYRAQMKYIQALTLLPKQDAFASLAEQAFRSVHDYSNVTALVAGYQLWDRLGEDPQPAIQALASPDPEVADRAQWALVEAGPAVLPAVRKALGNRPELPRRRLVAVLAWQADSDAIPSLYQLENSSLGDRQFIEWAIDKIESMDPTTTEEGCCRNNPTR
jgi:glycerophosphoryl diester phosphodiesterase/HEAT repeat protein